MNFLPLVITFLLIFGAFSVSFMSSQSMDKTEALSYRGKLRALRSAYNKKEDILYDANKGTSKSKSNGKNPSKTDSDKSKAKTYFRITRTGSQSGAINLACLANDSKDKDHKWLYEKTILYLEQMYAKASFIKKLNNPNWARELLNCLIQEEKKAWKEQQTFLSLEKICPEGPLKEHYPKLIRGTNTFDPENQRGYLPLEACIHFIKPHEKEVQFPFANPAMLIIFFGKEQFEKIKEAEWPNEVPRKGASHQSRYSLSYSDLQTTLGRDLDPRIEKFFDFQYRSSQKIPKRSTDPSTHISAQILENPKKNHIP